MAESSSTDHPTPPGRAKAFDDAVRFYAEWWGGEPQVSLDLEPVSISAATQAVLPFTDPLPENVFERLFFLSACGAHNPQSRARCKPDICNCRPLLSQID
jgi:hypothetical protein